MITKKSNIERIYEINEKVFDRINSLIPDIVDNSQIEIDEDLENAAGYVTEGDYYGYKIGLSPKFNTFDESYDAYVRFKTRNNTATIEDFLEYTIAHEYGHMVDYMSAYSSKNYLMELSNKITQKQNTAITEGFAFWFANSLTGLKGLDVQVKSFYLKRADVKLLDYMFEIYSIEEEINGFEYVAKNSREIFWKNKN